MSFDIFRNCIGQNFALNEERVMIGALVKRYVLQLMSYDTGVSV